MKRMFVLLLAICLFTGRAISAFAADIIEIASTIVINGESVETDKDITLARSSDLTSEMFRFSADGTIAGFIFAENGSEYTTITVDNTNGDVAIVDSCTFSGISNNYIYVYGNAFVTNKAMISNSSFTGSTNSAISCRPSAETTINNCVFEGNTSSMQGGAINNGGNMAVSDCVIRNNHAMSGGGIFNSASLTLSGCKISDNTIQNPKFGSDIFSLGTLMVEDLEHDGVGFYEESTGQKVALPLTSYDDTAKLVWLTEEQAVDYFAPQGSVEDNTSDNLPAEPQEPIQPPETSETPTESEETTDSSTKNDYTPAYRHKRTLSTSANSHRSQQQINSTPAPRAVVKPPLVCNGVILDTSQTVILQGYGDGLLHEDDPLTRAQLSTILYRLLDADTIARYSSTALTYADIPADAWYLPYVQTISNAGIVSGVGSGRFDPDGLVSWAQIISVLSRFVEPQEYTLQHISSDDWVKQPIQTSVALGWITDSADFVPNAVISRGDLVKLINRVFAQ